MTRLPKHLTAWMAGLVLLFALSVAPALAKAQSTTGDQASDTTTKKTKKKKAADDQTAADANDFFALAGAARGTGGVVDVQAVTDQGRIPDATGQLVAQA